jgi:uncharacterized protein YkwD
MEILCRPGRGTARFALMLGLVLLGACAGEHELPGDPSFYRSMASKDAQLDAATAASMISGYRANNGLGAVRVDPQLMKLAREQAQAMASRNKVGHNVAQGFKERVKAYPAKAAAENVGAGYHTLAEAFSGWRDSPPHRANMLLTGATHMGIAAVYAPQSKYKVFWALILAAPAEAQG